MSKKQKPVDWEKLCRQLQEALAKEMKESEEKDELIKEQDEVIEGLVMISHYLESKLGIYGN